jgi:hypothetical protein
MGHQSYHKRDKRQRKQDLLKARAHSLKRLYNLTTEQYNEMLEQQNNKCAICGITKTECGEFLCVDHDHTTNEVRGLLCKDCNLAIAKFKDNEQYLIDAIAYLHKYNIKNELVIRSIGA